MSKFSSLRSTEGFWLTALQDTNVVYYLDENLSDVNMSQRVYKSGWYMMGFSEDKSVQDRVTIIEEDTNESVVYQVDYMYRHEYETDGTSHWEVYSPTLDGSIDPTLERINDNISKFTTQLKLIHY